MCLLRSLQPDSGRRIVLLASSRRHSSKREGCPEDREREGGDSDMAKMRADVGEAERYERCGNLWTSSG